jgi:hypothetical protein
MIDSLRSVLIVFVVIVFLFRILFESLLLIGLIEEFFLFVLLRMFQLVLRHTDLMVDFVSLFR